MGWQPTTLHMSILMLDPSLAYQLVVMLIFLVPKRASILKRAMGCSFSKRPTALEILGHPWVLNLFCLQAQCAHSLRTSSIIPDSNWKCFILVGSLVPSGAFVKRNYIHSYVVFTWNYQWFNFGLTGSALSKPNQFTNRSKQNGLPKPVKDNRFGHISMVLGLNPALANYYLLGTRILL